MEPLSTTTSDSKPVEIGTTGDMGFNASQPQRKVNLREQVYPHLEMVAKLLPVAWSVFLLVGGLIFLIYFQEIGFIPELDLKASLTLLAVSAITGSVLFLMVVIIFLFPSAIWINMLRKSEPLKKLLSDQDGKLLYRRLSVWLCLPICVSLFLFNTIILLQSKGIVSWWITCVVMLGTLLVGGGILAWCLRKKLKCDLDAKKKWEIIGSFSFNLFHSAIYFLMCMLILMLLMISTLIPILPASNPNIMLIVFMVILTLAACSIAFFDAAVVRAFFDSPDRRPLMITALVVFLIFCLIFLGFPSYITHSVMYTYKFGNVNGASLVLDESGCTIAKYHGFQPSTILKEGTCRLECVKILSRLGSTYYIDTGRYNSPSKCYSVPSTSTCFTIPAQNVLSWGTASKVMLKECASRFSSPSSSGSLTLSP